MRRSRLVVVFAVVFLLTLSATAPATALARESCPCPDGHTCIAKYQCRSGMWELDEGSDEFIITGDCQEATVEGDYDSLWVKAAKHCEEQESPIRAIDGHDVSHVSMCREENGTAVTLRSFRAAPLCDTVLCRVFRFLGEILWKGE